ncbi:MAG: Bifunctional protein FolD [candidate division WS6 bacterium GW2011_GWF2_39_15]|uniref:Bifunctional protein FolD n=1 Tax=candidate division WS6 bacterium GW2011_GWF2_39_15 TaxID=1619100 RepID=A0A0G0MQZ8_9BACT|nr:MAG: Bifunctional protein FolD [candidate division WS6 bacterium GW2011_GWF2_39_15]
MVQILDGRKISKEIAQELKEKISSLPFKPRLDIVQVGKDYATSLYVGIKKKVGEDIGVEVVVHEFDYSIETKDLIEEINKIEKASNGILVQLPLPDHIDTKRVLDRVDIRLDVDGLNSATLEKLRRNESDATPSATALGVITLLKRSGIELNGKSACVIGNSIEVGQPLSAMFKNEGCDVTVCDINTPNTKELSMEADIVTVAVGKVEIVTKEWVKEGAIVVDIGINRVGDRIVGDVKYEEVKEIASFITPVPGGVGPMTVVSLFSNLVKLSSANE